MQTPSFPSEVIGYVPLSDDEDHIPIGSLLRLKDVGGKFVFQNIGEDAKKFVSKGVIEEGPIESHQSAVFFEESTGKRPIGEDVNVPSFEGQKDMELSTAITVFDEVVLVGLVDNPQSDGGAGFVVHEVIITEPLFSAPFADGKAASDEFTKGSPLPALAYLPLEDASLLNEFLAKFPVASLVDSLFPVAFKTIAYE